MATMLGASCDDDKSFRARVTALGLGDRRGTDHSQSMAIKGFVVHDRESGAYALTDSGRAAFLTILGDAGLT